MIKAVLVAVLISAVTAQECGLVPLGRIVGGSEASAHSYPWQGSLQTTGHICGLTLINSQWVVTAAHCVDGTLASAFKIVLGEHSLSTVGNTELTLKASKVIKHPSYSSTGAGFPNDIALIKLDKAVTFNNYIQPACLPAATQEFFGNRDCWISGWGDTKNTGNSKLLNELNVEVRDQNTCKSLWGATYINSGHICVANGNTGACNGDSGGPLSCKVNGKFYVAGATSWGRTGCTTTGYPSVYTRISYFRSWVDTTIAAN